MITASNQSKNVCVIGAGPSGLVAAIEIRKEGHNVVVIEQNNDIGGQWLYNPSVEAEDPLGRCSTLKVHSSVYDSLRLHTPRETMGFSDFPILVKNDPRHFPGHREVFLYLQDFCEAFELREMIRFDTRVENVKMLNGGDQIGKDLSWVVKSIDNKNEMVVEELFDVVVVATGHYSHPRLPTIKGIDDWRIKQLHSHVYRVPDPFLNEVVVVVGNSLTGLDIVMELLQVAKEVHSSSKSLDLSEGLSKVISKHDTLHHHLEIDSLHEDGRVVLVDGSCIAADTIIYCTGYEYTFPFLESKGIIAVDDGRVGPPYEHTFPPSLAPSLTFIGIPRKIIGFPFFESQARWIAQLLSAKTSLPSSDDMMLSIKEFYHAKDLAGIPKYNTHDIANFEYCDKYADFAGFPRVEEWKTKLCLAALIKAEVDLEIYREFPYEEYRLPEQDSSH
ncbi:flavin-containing monooxygenase FMO GS-OX-like 8 [Apium graveolens]|uniref:flavin-containing monooxygenase FMO GS-OX-like 8 n=1 Tax=Apium graveolens TaxID=4045 RepID=UPI003D78ED1E